MTQTTSPTRPHDPGWRDHANCFGTWDEPGWHPDERTVDPEPIVERICLGCPVRLACLDHALRHGEDGVWGGTTTRQREKIRRGRSRKACPLCHSVHVRRKTMSEICMSCGVSWKVPPV